MVMTRPAHHASPAKKKETVNRESQQTTQIWQMGKAETDAL